MISLQKILLHGTIAGLLSAIAGIIYSIAYSEAMMVNFSDVINPISLFGSNLIGTLLASLGYFFLLKKWKWKTDFVFNTIFLFISFGSFIGPFSAELPLTIEFPEMFIGLAMPMHLFPIAFWLVTKPLFFK